MTKACILLFDIFYTDAKTNGFINDFIDVSEHTDTGKNLTWLVKSAMYGNLKIILDKQTLSCSISSWTAPVYYNCRYFDVPETLKLEIKQKLLSFFSNSVSSNIYHNWEKHFKTEQDLLAWLIALPNDISYNETTLNIAAGTINDILDKNPKLVVDMLELISKYSDHLQIAYILSLLAFTKFDISKSTIIKHLLKRLLCSKQTQAANTALMIIDAQNNLNFSKLFLGLENKIKDKALKDCYLKLFEPKPNKYLDAFNLLYDYDFESIKNILEEFVPRSNWPEFIKHDRNGNYKFDDVKYMDAKALLEDLVRNQ